MTLYDAQREMEIKKKFGSKLIFYWTGFRSWRQASSSVQNTNYSIQYSFIELAESPMCEGCFTSVNFTRCVQ